MPTVGIYITVGSDMLPPTIPADTEPALRTPLAVTVQSFELTWFGVGNGSIAGGLGRSRRPDGQDVKCASSISRRAERS